MLCWISEKVVARASTSDGWCPLAPPTPWIYVATGGLQVETKEEEKVASPAAPAAPVFGFGAAGGAEKVASPAAPAAPVFGFGATGGFGFGAAAATFDPTAFASAPRVAAGAAAGDAGGDADDATDVEAECKAEFTPLVKLEHVVVASGEENEEIQFEAKSKAYRFLEGEWKERGVVNPRTLLPHL